MSYEEARRAAQDNLHDALNVAPGTDLNIEYYDCIDNIIEAAVEKCKEELGKQTVTTAGLHQVKSEGYREAVQAAVRLVDAFVSDERMIYGANEIKLLRWCISALGGQS